MSENIELAGSTTEMDEVNLGSGAHTVNRLEQLLT